MKRNAMDELTDWKNSSHRKPLIINGARQVGKTWLVHEFARQNFPSFAPIVFLNNEEMQEAFSGNLDPDRLLTIIGAATNTTPQDGKTLIFFDEIQECPRAITSLKLFCEQKPEIPVVAAGSLLGIALHKGNRNDTITASWPVGKVNFLNLHPLTFDEYVGAAGGESLKQILLSEDHNLKEPFAERFYDLLKTYLFVGGMPEVMQIYLDTHDFSKVRVAQTELINGYELDFSKHVASPLETEHLRQLWRSIPVQLAHENASKRFVYASVRKGGRGRDYKDAIMWLKDAGLITKVCRVSKPGIPLTAYQDNNYFKLFLLDVGLLGALIGLSAKTLIEGNRLFTEYKGVYAEQFICQQLVASHLGTPFYWGADGKQYKGEVDFIVQAENSPLPIEVKAGNSVRGSSLRAFAHRYNIPRSIRFSTLGYEEQSWMVNLPLYEANGFFKSGIYNF